VLTWDSPRIQQCVGLVQISWLSPASGTSPRQLRPVCVAGRLSTDRNGLNQLMCTTALGVAARPGT
jgi:hypothetical protein